MPRDGSGVASPPPGTTATPNTTILSSAHNNLRNDIYALMNTPWPVALGGTGGNSPATALAALGGAPLATTATKVEARRNRIVNHDMRVSFEANGASGTANGFYPVEQWAQYRVTSAGTLTVQQVAAVTPAGSPNRLRATVTTADASLAAGEYWTLSQNLEGSNVADFRYGSASACASVLRFGFKGPAGTYAVALHNSGATRSYVALFTIGAGQANTDTVQTVAIPGDTSASQPWLTADGVIGITLDIVLACGSTFQGATGWQAGNILGTSAVTNGMASAGAVFELFDVGLRLDPDATGVYGQYEVGETDAVYRSERYYSQGNGGQVLFNGSTSSGSTYYVAERFVVPMCKPPSMVLQSISAVGFPASGGSATGVTTKGFIEGRVASSTLTLGIFQTNWNAIARLS